MAAKEYPSPIQEHGHEGEDGFDYYADDVSPSGCGCFCFKWWRGGSERAHPYMRRGGGEDDESWAMSKFKKAREFTEVVAGPKWKNFIRKVGGYWRSDKKRNNNTSKFGYDAQSYALNFDGGGGDRGEEDGLLMKGFSARFVGSSRNDQERQAGIGLS